MIRRRPAFWPTLFGLAAIGACASGPAPALRPAPRPLPAEIAATVLLLGDAGEPAADGEPVLLAAAREIGDAGARTTVVFMGDNIYPGGMPDVTDT